MLPTEFDEELLYASHQAFSELCPPAKIPDTSQLYLPILTDKTIVPHGRHFLHTCLFAMQ